MLIQINVSIVRPQVTSYLNLLVFHLQRDFNVFVFSISRSPVRSHSHTNLSWAHLKIFISRRLEKLNTKELSACARASSSRKRKSLHVLRSQLRKKKSSSMMITSESLNRFGEKKIFLFVGARKNCSINSRGQALLLLHKNVFNFANQRQLSHDRFF